MARWLKQSTAYIFRIGPFVDDTDFKTPETGLTIAQADIQISKAGGAFAQTSDAAPTTTHDADGWYQCPLTTTDTGTLGNLTVQVAVSGALPVWEHFLVLPANVYDSLSAGSDVLDVSVTQLGGVAQSLTDLKDLADTGYDPSTHKIAGVVLTDTCTTNTDMRGTDSAALASVCTEARLAELDAANIPADTARLTAARAQVLDDWINGGRLDLLLDACSTHDAAAVKTAIEAAGSHLALIKAVTDAITADGSGLSAVPWNAAWDAEVQSECADALAAFSCADGETLTAHTLGAIIRQLKWISTGKMTVDDATGEVTLYKTDGTTPADVGSPTITDDSTTTTRLAVFGTT